MNPIPSHVKGLIFDLDGTLVDTMPLHIEAWCETGKHFGVEITPYMVNAMAGIPTLHSVVKLNELYGYNLDPLAVKTRKDLLLEDIISRNGNYHPITPVYEVARQYKEKIPMTIGTGSSRTQAIRVLRDMQIIDWFQGIVAADDVTHFKPDPETFLKCASIMKLHPEECLVFEDGALGILAAKNAGMEYIDVSELLTA